MTTLQRGMPVKKCPPCQGNRHSTCFLHFNDGVTSHEEFVDVECECPCEGEVHERNGLIKLVARLRKELADVRQRHTDEQIARDRNNQLWFEKWAPFADLFESMIEPDDEGNIPFRPGYGVDPDDYDRLQQAWWELREEMK